MHTQSILIVTCCLCLGAGIALAEPEKKGAKAAKHPQAKGAHQAQAGGGGQRAKHANINRQGFAGAEANMMHRAPVHHAKLSGQGAKTGVPAVQHVARGGKAEVKHFDFANTHTNVQSVTFKANRRIVGAEHWTGANYVVFRNYHAVWHDHVWWAAHYPRIILIGGGWYYWNAGFWYPAWGYAPAQAYYAYDGPIYAYNGLPPDQVVANVQGQLQNQGYYNGEVDGQLGPLTRAALADYQRDHGLTTTAAIDQPTMESLGFAGGEGEPG